MRAWFIKQVRTGAVDQRLYRLEPPITYFRGRTEVVCPYVIVSAVARAFEDDETFVLPANRAGEILGLRELPGSLYGECNHERALTEAGYQLQKEGAPPDQE